MKNAFSLNVTTNENETDKFKVKKLSEELARKKEQSENLVTDITRAASIPRWLEWVAVILGGFGLIVLVSILRTLTDVGFETAYKNAGWLFYAGGASLIVALVIFVIRTYKNKTTMSTPAVQNTFTESERLVNRCYEDLGVPYGADDIDVFCEAFKTKNGKTKRAGIFFQYLNVSCKIYRDGENLYFADTDGVYGFPISNFTGIVAIKKNATFNCWTKQQPFNKPPYKQYKVRNNGYGVLFVKPYYSVRFTAFNEEYEIIIPAYEFDTLQKYVTLNVMYEGRR